MFRAILIGFLSYIFLQIITRISMFLIADSVSISILEIFKALSIGFIYDVTVWSILSLPLLIVIFLRREWILKITLFIFDFLTILIAVTQVMFFREFGTNFNFIAVDYLIYTNELLGNIWQSFNIPLIIIAIIIITTLIYKFQCRYLNDSQFHFQNIALLIIFIPLILLPFVQSNWRELISDNRYNVEISSNGVYEFVRAFKNNELDYNTFYMTLPEDEILNNINKKISKNDVSFNIENAKKPNVIIITVESLNADYLSIFGGSGLTPNLDKLVDKSYIFTRMYATGTRTVRGLEAITLSLPPTPGQSIVRRQNNDNLSSLGNAFKENGYACDFIYGGYGYFDNMNTFFEGNGYTVKDRTYIPDEEIIDETIWGVADEVLFTQVLKSMDEHFKNNESAFEMVMTTSNHRPFTFPEDRIDLEPGTRNAAVKYTDWAINDFLERAASKSWFDNTIFVIVADHQALAAGKTDLPINRYHIPCLIYAPKLINVGKCDRLISQTDIAPTLLNMLNLPYNEKFLGHDIFSTAENEDRAFISTYQLLGYVKNDNLIILSPNKSATTYHIDDWNNADYTLSNVDDNLIKEAVTYYQGAAYLFKSGNLKIR